MNFGIGARLPRGRIVCFAPEECFNFYQPDATTESVSNIHSHCILFRECSTFQVQARPAPPFHSLSVALAGLLFGSIKPTARARSCRAAHIYIILSCLHRRTQAAAHIEMPRILDIVAFSNHFVRRLQKNSGLGPTKNTRKGYIKIQQTLQECALKGWVLHSAASAYFSPARG